MDIALIDSSTNQELFIKKYKNELDWPALIKHQNISVEQLDEVFKNN